MSEMIIALLMIINGEIKEARIQTSMSECLKGARVANRGLTIDSHIKRIRKKFKKGDEKFSSIETRYGSGYRWNVN